MLFGEAALVVGIDTEQVMVLSQPATRMMSKAGRRLLQVVRLNQVTPPAGAQQGAQAAGSGGRYVCTPLATAV